MVTIIEDAREYIFPVFLVSTDGNGVFLESRIFLGTGFFVTKHGDAITASHVIPTPDNLPPNKRLIAIIIHDGEQKVCWINAAAKFDKFDCAIIKVNIEQTKYFEIHSCDVVSGTDVSIIGMPSHEIHGSGKEMRFLKGYVTLSVKRLELNFPIPAGMSGSPVFVGSKVVGYATGMVRSEEVEDSFEEIEEIEEISNKKEIIRITEVRRAIYYGIAYPFYHLKVQVDPVLDNKDIIDFISYRNLK